jgi:hypothetical protein
MRHTIATNVFDTDSYSYADYLDYCEANMITPAENKSAEYYEWVYEEIAVNFTADMEAIKDFDAYNNPVTVRGSLGLWDGVHEIVPKEMETVYDAILVCIGSSDVAEVEVEWNNGVIVVRAYHHDGVNVFEIGGELPYLYD